MIELKHKTGIKQRNKKQINFDDFHEESTIENKSTFKKLNSSSSIGSKTIYVDHTKQNSKNIILKMNEIINDYPEKYYKQRLKSDWLKFFINLFASFLHIIIIYTYVKSINACSNSLTLNECIKKIDIGYYYKVYLYCFISGSLISLIIVLIIVKYVSICQSPIIIIEIIIFICISHKDDVYSNGFYSLNILILFIIISFIILLFFILFLVRLSKREYFYSVFFFFVSLSSRQYVYSFF